MQWCVGVMWNVILLWTKKQQRMSCFSNQAAFWCAYSIKLLKLKSIINSKLRTKHNGLYELSLSICFTKIILPSKFLIIWGYFIELSLVMLDQQSYQTEHNTDQCYNVCSFSLQLTALIRSILTWLQSSSSILPGFCIS